MIKDLHIPRETLLAIAEEAGTPVYVYNAQVIEEQYKKLTQAFSVKNLKIHYACKALTNIHILKYIRSLGAGLDAVSIEEVRLGLLAGFEPEEIIFTPNSVAIEEIETAMRLGVNLNIDDIEALEYMGLYYPEQPVCIRINPHLMAGGNMNISVGHIDSKFGISIHQLPLVLRLVNRLNIKVVGVHMHTGSDILDVDVFNRAAGILLDIADHFEQLEYIDFGSGFKVAYKQEDYETDIASFGKSFSTMFNAYCQKRGKDIKVIFEPGKFLVSESGYFLVQTNLVKQTTSTVFAGVNSGFNHLIRPMFYNAYHEIVNLSNPEGQPRIYNIVGYICETDTLGYDRKIQEIREKDILCIYNAGAYCYMMSSNYNSRVRPAEVFYVNGKSQLIRRRETLDDLLSTIPDEPTPMGTSSELKDTGTNGNQ
jgi:diaminopimelate decarboxylase